MLTISPKHRVYLAVSAIDFRAGMGTLRALCYQTAMADPFSGHFFIFTNKRKTAIKILFYDSQGFWLCHKRLSKGCFSHWPRSADCVVQLEHTQLQVLIQNGDPTTIHTSPPWRDV